MMHGGCSFSPSLKSDSAWKVGVLAGCVWRAAIGLSGSEAAFVSSICEQQWHSSIGLRSLELCRHAHVYVPFSDIQKDLTCMQTCMQKRHTDTPKKSRIFFPVSTLHDCTEGKAFVKQ